MQIISNLTVFTGTIPDKASQTDNEFANNIFGFLNYSGVPFVSDLNIIVDELNTLSDEIETAAIQTAQHSTDAQTAYEAVQTTIALLSAGTIDDSTIGLNKAYSNQKINELFSLREDKLGVNIPSASTTTIGTAGLGDTIHITGTTTITSFGTVTTAGIRRTLIFDEALTLTHNSSSLICPGATNISIIAGTVMEVIAETTTTWRVLSITHPNISFTELAYLNNLESNILTLISNATPTGTISMFGASTAPTGYLKCNGAVISRTTYSALFAVIGTTFGAGDGSTTFALPDLRAYFPRGWDDGRGIDTGRVFGSNQADAYLNHSHTGSTDSQGNHTHTVPKGSSMTGDSDFATSLSSGGTKLTSSAGAHTHNVTVATSTTGGTETRPKNIALLYCIKY